jgi:hypothetical protein
MNSANTLYNQNIGYQPWTQSVLAPIDPWQQQGMNAAYLRANEDIVNQGGTPGWQQAMGLAQQQISNQGITAPLQQQAANYNQVFQNNAQTNNPYLQSQIDAQNRIISDKVNSAMEGAGRYGSSNHADVLGRSLAEASYPVLAQDYAMRQGVQLGALQGGTGIYNQGLQRAGQFAQNLGSMYQQAYAPQEEMMNLGQYNTNRAQTELNAQIQAYNQQQAYPWEMLARNEAIDTGAGALGGLSTTNTLAYRAPQLQRMLGGALAGGAMGSSFGPLGAGIGALGGAGLGYM